MSTDDDTRMIQETVAKFVDRELIPIERRILKAKVSGVPASRDRRTTSGCEKSRRNWVCGGWMRRSSSAARTCRR